MKNFAEINRASTGAKKTNQLFEKLWEHGRTLRRVGLVLVMCLMAIPQVWASEELKGVYMTYDFNGSGSNYEYYSSDNKKSNPVVALGPLTTGTFKITAVYWKTKDNWYTEKINAYGWYNLGGGDTKFAEYDNYTGSNGDNCDCEHEIQNTAVNYTVATANTGNSGLFTFSHWWIVNFHYSGGYTPTYCSNGGDNYNFTYQILPPNATAITATPTGAVSGSGTELDPYIVPYGGNLTIALSGSTKERADDNSSVQYSVDGGSTWGTSSKTFSNVTATSTQNWVFKARCYNSTASLASPSETTKTVYYKAAKGVSVYKFQTKSSGLGTSNVCSTASTDYAMTTSNSLSTLVGGSLTAWASNTGNLKYNENSFSFNGGSNAYLKLTLDNEIKSGDVLRIVNSGAANGSVYVRHTSNTTATNQITVSGTINSNVQTITIPAGFASKKTLWLVRASNTSYIQYVEILRPYVVTLDANTNGGKVGGNNTATMYFAAGEPQALPHATKSSNRFTGWFTTAGGSSEAANPYTATGNATLYAQFETCASIASGTVYKFQVKTGLTNGNTGITGTFDVNKSNYLSTLIGGTLTGYDKDGTKMGIQGNNAFKINDKSNAYLQVDLDCPIQAGDTIITTITNSGTTFYIAKPSASTTSVQDLSVGSNQKVVVPAGLVDESTLLLKVKDNSKTTCISSFEIKRPVKYTVSYNNGGGTGTMTSHTVAKGADQALTANTFTKNGYTFSCWHANVAVKVGGSTISAGGDISDGATLQAISSDVTLTAQWTCTTPTFGTNLSTTQVDYKKDASATALTVAATANSGDVSYQWYSNDGNNYDTPTTLTNCTTATYTPLTTSAGTTYYFCVATNKTDECSVTTNSSIAKIVVTACTEPTTTFADGDYTIGGSALDLRDLISADATSEGAITFAVTDANGTGATIAGDGYSFSATTAGTCTVTATQAADETNYYCSKEIEATITVSNPTYSVTYKANNSTAESDVVRGTESTFASNSTTSFTAPSTKAFAGWNTKADGSGTHYDVGDAVPSAITVYAEWWYKVYYIASSTSESNDITAALEDAKFAVSVKATTSTSYNASDYSDYALVVLSESLDGSNAGTDNHELKVIVGLDKPILNLKTYFYGADGDASKRWKWGAPNAGKKPKCIYVKNSKYANLTSHPIYSGLTPDGSDSIQILKTPLTTKPIQPIGSFTSGKEGYTLALVPNNSSGSGTAIHEMTAAQRSTATGETITSKYLMISIQSGELSNLSDGGKKLIKNAANYLVTGSQWVPQYKITHSAASDGSYTIQVGAGSATDDDTMSAAGTTITLAATPEDGYKLDSWTVTGDVSSDAITVTSNQFTMPAEAVTVAATFVADSYTISFDGNGADGGTEVDDVTGIDSGNDANLPENTWEKTEHTFAGWKTNVALTYVEKGGEDEINVAADGIVPNEATIKNITGNITLTAQWQVNEYDVHFWVGIDVSVEGRFSTYEYGEEKVLPTTVLRSGYLFDGWYDNFSLTGDPVTQMPADATGEQDYYPKWKALSAKCLYITGEVIDAYNDVAADPGYYMLNDVKYVFGEGYDDNEDALVLPSTADPSYIYIDPKVGTLKEVQLHISDIADKNTADKGISWGFDEDDSDVGSVGLSDLDEISDHEFSFRPTEADQQCFVFQPHATTLTIDNICVFYEAKTYSVTYDRGTGASGTAPSDLTTYYYNDVVTVADTTGTGLKKTGCTFRGWFDGTTFYVVGDKFKITGNTTLTAVWQSDSEGTTVTLTYFETSKHTSSKSLPDALGYYFYGYPNSTMSSSEALTMTSSGSATKGENSGTDMILDRSSELDIYANNATTETPATFGSITAISLNVKRYHSTKYGKISIAVGETTVVSDTSLVNVTNSAYVTWSFNNLANLSGKVIITHGGAADGQSASSDHKCYLDNIAITVGGGSSNYTVSFACKTGYEALDGILPGDIIGVPSGAKIGTPADPFAIGYAFLGWYKDAACSADQKVMIDTLVISKDTTIYAKWVENVKTFTGGASTTAWETEGNWDAAGMPISAYPYCYSQVYIKAPAEMAKNTKEHVGRVDIVNDGSSNTGKLTIASGAMLIVYDKVSRITNWSTKERLATIAEDIYIGSERDDSALSWRENGALNGALIMGDYDREEQADSATVQFATQSYTKSGDGSWGEREVNQYIGIPFVQANVSDYKPYEKYKYAQVYLMEHDRPNCSWLQMSEDQDMYEFVGYDIICYSFAPDAYTSPKPIFDLKGELASTDEERRIHLRGYEGWYGAEYNENILANSWTAPIDIASFEVSDFENAEATIYMFNAGTQAEYDDLEWASNYSTYPGQYTAIPINDLKLHPYYYEGYKTIPSMQSFSVITLDNDGSSLTYHDLSYLTMDYKRLVYDPAVEAVGVTTERMHAPRRVPTMEEEPLAIMLHVHGVSGMGDRIRILEREDFSYGRDNGWETSKLLGIIEAPSLYAVTEVGDQATVAVPDVEGLVLTFQAGEYDNVYTFNFEYDEIEEPLYLLDRKTGIYTRVLTENTYSFVTTDKNFNERFLLTRNYQMPEVATGLENAAVDSSLNERVQKVLINDMIYILRDGHIYDATGKMLK